MNVKIGIDATHSFPKNVLYSIIQIQNGGELKKQ